MDLNRNDSPNNNNNNNDGRKPGGNRPKGSIAQVESSIYFCRIVAL